MAQFMMIIADRPDERAGMAPDVIEDYYRQVGQWWAEQERRGHIKAGAGARLQGRETARTVRVQHAKATVTDGPFVESKEVIGGFGIIEAPSIDDAVEVAKTWPGLFVAIEIRPLLEM